MTFRKSWCSFEDLHFPLRNDVSTNLLLSTPSLGIVSDPSFWYITLTDTFGLYLDGADAQGVSLLLLG